MPYLPEIHAMTERKDSYEVEIELDVRKILECNTGNKFEFTKNDDKKSVDLICNQYTVTSTDWRKEVIGYIEVEEGCSWAGDDIPEYWSTFSFLARKVYQFDRDKDKWTSNLVPDADKTIYLKVSSDLKGAFCCSVTDIAEQGKGSKGKKGLKYLYNDTYVDVPLDNEKVSIGWENCVDFIVNFFTR